MNFHRTLLCIVLIMGALPLALYASKDKEISRLGLNAFVPDEKEDVQGRESSKSESVTIEPTDAESTIKIEPEEVNTTKQITATDSPINVPEEPLKDVAPVPAQQPDIEGPKVEAVQVATPATKPAVESAKETPVAPVEAEKPLSPDEVVAPSEFEEKLPEITESAPLEKMFEEDEDNEEDIPLEEPQTSGKKEQYVVMKKSEKLSKIIDKIAAKKGLNIILPHGADTLKETVNFDTPRKLSLAQAEDYLHMLLQMAGYRLRPQDGFFIVSKINEASFSREALPLYVNVAPEMLPKNSQQIRTINYLANFRVPADNTGNDPLNMVLKETLGSQKMYLFDQKTNAVIIIGAANKIATAMSLILELDMTGSPEDLQIIPLYYTSAPTVAKVLNEQIIATAQDSRRALRNSSQANEDFYFAPNTRVVADSRTNSLFILGLPAAVEKIKDLIRNYLDIAPESGKSILHVYDLQYLNSREFAPQLQKIVQQSESEQSRKEGGGPHRFFDDVIIIPEEVETTEARTVGGSTTQFKSRFSIGGNRLIIACTNEDWIQIKSIIEQLDKTELQVIIEVMIVDLTVVSRKKLQAQTRKPSWANLPDNLQFETAQITSQILDKDTNPTSLTADLLRILSGGTSMAVPASSGSEDNGSMIISLRDPRTDGIWSVLKLLDSWTERKVLSHPFLIAKNNTEGYEFSSEKRRNDGPIDQNNSAVTTIKVKDFEAKLSVNITPHISSIDRLSLQTKVTVENFADATGYNTFTRDIENNAALNSGQILVIGGLTSVEDAENSSGWPLLSRIPIIGNLFKASTKKKTRTNLAIFIHPTIVDPKLRTGLNKFTNDSLGLAKDSLETGYLFSNLRDPVTRIFFSDGGRGNGIELFERYNQQIALRPKPDNIDTVSTEQNPALDAYKKRIQEEQAAEKRALGIENAR